MRSRHKFRAVKTERNGFKFDSKKEGNFYDTLVLKQKAGIILGFLMQVPFKFPGNITYRMDFLVFYTDGTCEGIEVKGFETKTWKIKQKLLEQFYPWMKVRVV